MSSINKTLQYVHYTIGLIWIVLGSVFFFGLDKQHQTLIVAVYGLILGIVIIYIGFLHNKASLIRSLVFPLTSLTNLAVVILIVISYLTSEHGGLITLSLLVVLGIISVTSLFAGTLEVKEVWRKSVLATTILAILGIVWTIILASS